MKVKVNSRPDCLLPLATSIAKRGSPASHVPLSRLHSPTPSRGLALIVV